MILARQFWQNLSGLTFVLENVSSRTAFGLNIFPAKLLLKQMSVFTG